MLSTQSFDQLYVCLFVAVVCQDAQECFTFVQSFDRFTKTTTNTVMNHRQFENFLNSIKDVHWSSSSRCRGRCGSIISFHIRHDGILMCSLISVTICSLIFFICPH